MTMFATVMDYLLRTEADIGSLHHCVIHLFGHSMGSYHATLLSHFLSQSPLLQRGGIFLAEPVNLMNANLGARLRYFDSRIMII